MVYAHVRMLIEILLLIQVEAKLASQREKLKEKQMKADEVKAKEREFQELVKAEQTREREAKLRAIARREAEKKKKEELKAAEEKEALAREREEKKKAIEKWQRKKESEMKLLQEKEKEKVAKQEEEQKARLDALKKVTIEAKKRASRSSLKGEKCAKGLRKPARSKRHSAGATANPDPANSTGDPDFHGGSGINAKPSRHDSPERPEWNNDFMNPFSPAEAANHGIPVEFLSVEEKVVEATASPGGKLALPGQKQSGKKGSKNQPLLPPPRVDYVEFSPLGKEKQLEASLSAVPADSMSTFAGPTTAQGKLTFND